MAACRRERCHLERRWIWFSSIQKEIVSAAAQRGRGGEGGRQTDRRTDRQTDTDRQRQTDTDRPTDRRRQCVCVCARARQALRRKSRAHQQTIMKSGTLCERVEIGRLCACRPISAPIDQQLYQHHHPLRAPSSTQHPHQHRYYLALNADDIHARTHARTLSHTRNTAPTEDTALYQVYMAPITIVIGLVFGFLGGVLAAIIKGPSVARTFSDSMCVVCLRLSPTSLPPPPCAPFSDSVCVLALASCDAVILEAPRVGCARRERWGGGGVRCEI